MRRFLKFFSVQRETYQDAWEDSRRTASAEEARSGIVGHPDTRQLDPSGSSLDPKPKRSKTTSVTDNDSLANQLDEDKRTSDISPTGNSR